MKNIAIIPARSGSKGLKDKNIKPLNGKPLIAYSIEAALDSGLFDEVMVSTDSEMYADISREYGAHVPFLRPDELATDTASSKDVILDVLAKYEVAGKTFDTFTLLQPTSPLRTVEDIRNAYQIFEEKSANAVVGVTEVDHSPLLCNTLPADSSMADFLRRDVKDKPRQMLDVYYRINGAMYIAGVDYYREFGDFYYDRCYAYIMPKERSIDIDCEMDFMMSEFNSIRNSRGGEWNSLNGLLVNSIRDTIFPTLFERQTPNFSNPSILEVVS